MGNCSKCKYKKIIFEGELNSIGSNPIQKDMSLLNSNPDSVLGDMYGKCEKGNQDTFVTWWKNSKNVPADQNIDVPCYEPTEFTKRTDNIIDMLDKMKELVSKSK